MGLYNKNFCFIYTLSQISTTYRCVFDILIVCNNVELIFHSFYFVTIMNYTFSTTLNCIHFGTSSPLNHFAYIQTIYQLYTTKRPYCFNCSKFIQFRIIYQTVRFELWEIEFGHITYSFDSIHLLNTSTSKNLWNQKCMSMEYKANNNNVLETVTRSIRIYR